MPSDIVNRTLKSYYTHLALLAAAGFALAAIMITPYGPGISTDAVNYLATGENLALGRGFISYTGGIYLLWPPLHPILLAIPKALFNIDPKVSAWALSLFSFPIIIFLTGVVFHKAIPGQKLWGYLGVLTVLFSTTLISLAINLGTDLPFVILTLLFFIAFQWFADRRDFLSFAILTLLALLAPIERYIGVTLIATGFLGILILYRRNLKRGIPLAILFGGIAMAPLLLWLGRNFVVTGTFFGIRNPSAWNPSLNLADATTKISHWFLPYVVSSNRLFLIAFSLALGIYIGRQPRVILKRISEKLQKPIIQIVILFSIIYFILGVFLIKSEDHILLYDDRYYAPIFVPLFLLLFLMIDVLFFSRSDDRRWSIPKIILVGLFGFWLVFPVYSDYKLWRKSNALEGVAFYNLYNFPRFNNSPVNENLLTQPLPEFEKIYSNQAAEIFLVIHNTSKGVPSRTDFFGNPVPLEEYTGEWPEASPALLVWYEPNEKDHLYTPEELAALVSFNVIYESEDGSIYQIEELNGP